MVYTNLSPPGSAMVSTTSTLRDSNSSFELELEFLDTEQLPKFNMFTWCLKFGRLARRKKMRIIIFGMMMFLMLFYILHSMGIWMLWSYKLSNFGHNYHLFQFGCNGANAIRKKPFVFVMDDMNVVIQFETNCFMGEIGFEWKKIQDGDISISQDWGSKSRILPQNVFESDRHYLYRVQVGPLTPISKYEYHIIRSSSTWNSHNVLYTGSFEWIGGHIDTKKNRYASSNKDIADISKIPISTSSLTPVSPKFNFPIRIGLVSDNQFGVQMFSKVLDTFKEFKPQYMIHLGDAVQQYENLQQWQTDFFDPIQYKSYISSVPFVYARGNHDAPIFSPEIDKVHAYAPVWPWYAVSIGHTRIIVLDSNGYSHEQNEWLQEQLRDKVWQEAEFRIIIVHIPPLIEFWDPYAWNEKEEYKWGRWVKDEWMPLWETYGVDLVISGHQHNYQRSKVGSRDPYHGHKRPVYAIIGGAGGELDNERVEDHGIYSVTKITHHAVRLEIYEHRLEWIAVDEHGREIDRFEIEHFA